jgi:hypothetical protein
MIGIDQKDKWLEERRGKFSSSEIGKLLIGDKKGGMFGETSMSYIKLKAIETLTVMWEQPSLEYLKPLLHGKAHELPAFNYYQKITGNYSMRYFGTDEPLYLAYNEDSGGSPDGIMGEEEVIHWLLELKCPINSSIHFDYLQMDNQYQLKDYNLQYYAQFQHLLMIGAIPGGHFFSFDDRYKNPKLKGKIIEILPDKKFQDNLDIRIQMATKEKYRIIEELLNKVA